MKSIALFGGSFDPPHIGHIAIVEALLRLTEIDKVVVLPTFLNPFKSKSFMSATDRFELLKDIFDSYEGVEISDFEVKQNRSVATIQSVKSFLKSYDKIYLVIGADNLETISRWQQYDELIKLVTIIVAQRDSIKIPKEFITLNIDEDISSSQIRKKGNRCKQEFKT